MISLETVFLPARVSSSESKVLMAEKRKKVRLLVYIVVGICLVPFAYLGRGLYYSAKTIHELLAENKHLKQAITNLTREEQIGYAKVIAQETTNGRLTEKDSGKRIHNRG